MVLRAAVIVALCLGVIVFLTQCKPREQPPIVAPPPGYGRKICSVTAGK